MRPTEEQLKNRQLATTPDVINTQSLSPSPTYNFATPQYSTPASSLTLEAPQPSQPTQTETTYNEYANKIKDLNSILTGETAFRTEQEKQAGVVETQNAMDDLSQRLRDIQRQEQAIPIQIQQEFQGKGATRGGTAPIEIGRRRENAIEALTVSSLIDATQNKLTSAQRKVDQAVKEKFGPALAEKAAILENLNLIIQSPTATREEKDRAEQQRIKQENEKSQIQSQQTEQKKIWDIAVESAKTIKDTTILDKIQRAGSSQEALNIAQSAGVFTAQPTYDQIKDDAGNIYEVSKDPGTGQIVGTPRLVFKGEPKAGTGGGNEQLYSGLSTTTSTAIRGKVSKFSTEPIIQNFATIQEGKNFASTLSDKTKNPADDQALIYSLAKALDPGSVVREGEYATAQKYAQSWIKAYGKGVEQAVLGTGFLSEEARKNIKKTIEEKYNASKKSYDNLYKNYSESINSLTGRKDGQSFLIDYATPSTETQVTPPKVKDGDIQEWNNVIYKVINGVWTPQ